MNWNSDRERGHKGFQNEKRWGQVGPMAVITYVGSENLKEEEDDTRDDITWPGTVESQGVVTWSRKKGGSYSGGEGIPSKRSDGVGSTRLKRQGVNWEVVVLVQGRFQ